jgi:CHAT domain-containing protein/Tfp pilus assembly protein PilF
MLRRQSLTANRALQYPVVLALLLLLGNESFVALGSAIAAKPQNERRTPQRGSIAEAERLLDEMDRLYSEGKYDEAIPVALHSLALTEKLFGPDDANVAFVLNFLGLTYMETGNYQEAGRSFRRSLTIFEKVMPDTSQIATVLHNLAILYSKKGVYEDAEPLERRALAIREKLLGPVHPNVANSLNTMASLYSKTGDYTQAESLYKRALAIREQTLPPDHPDIADSLNSMASLYHDKGDFTKAESLYKRAIAILERSSGQDHPLIAASLGNLAALYHRKADYVEAEALYQRALRITEKAYGPGHPYVANLLTNFAALYDDKGNLSQAESMYRRALPIMVTAFGPDHPNVAHIVNNLASLYDHNGDYDRAEPLYLRALAILEKALGQDHALVAVALFNLALLYHRKADYTHAEPLYQRALAINEKALGREHPSVGGVLSGLGGLFYERGDYTKAELLYQRALANAEMAYGPDSPNAAILLKDLAGLYAARGEYVKAITYLSRACEISEHSIASTLSTGSEREKFFFLVTLSGEINLALSLHVEQAPNQPAALRLALTTLLRRKGRAMDSMTDSISVLRRRLAPQDQKLLDELSAARSEFSTLVLKGSDKVDAAQYQANIKSLEQQVDTLEAKISRVSAEFRAQSRPITIQAIRAAIPANAALVEIVRFDAFDFKSGKNRTPRYAAYVLGNQGEAMWVSLGEAEVIDEGVRLLRDALRDPERNDVKEMARALDEKVMRPVRRLLGQASHLFISPDGELNLIPFGALVDENGKYLVENYSITYLSSGRDLLRMQVQTESRTAPVVIADPLYDLRTASRTRLVSGQVDQPGNLPEANRRSTDFTLKTYNPLPGTADEAAALAKLLPQGTQILLQARATEAALKKVNRPRVLHIATHGFFMTDQSQVSPAGHRSLRGTLDTLDATSLPASWENPLMRSGLILAGVKQGQSGADEDGVLTALEMSGLDLWGTKLVVLSACNTGVGEVRNGEGVYGLRRALVLAGSETQVMTLWKVSDSGTRDLITTYYKALQAGEGRTEALRQVQLAMLRGQLMPAKSTQSGRRGTSDTVGDASRDYRHPYYWAAFIASGDWRNMDGKEAGPH